MSDPLASPSKTATAAAEGEGNVDQGIEQNAENYVSNAETKLRDAIAGQGVNPYLTAAQQMAPTSYAVDPSNTMSFAVQPGPGTFTAGTTPQSPNSTGTVPARTTQPVARTPGNPATT